MIPKIWRLSENTGDDNLGLACTEQGLVLGRTLLIERRDGRFVVREWGEIECLFSLAYGQEATAQRLMPGRTLHPSFPTIDKIPEDIATSIKSIDLNAATYQDDARLTYRRR